MKKYCLLLLTCLISLYTRAQEKPETVTKKNWLTESVKEKFSVLKSDNTTKEGLYVATYTGTGAVIARGNYTDGKKTGIWHFFDTHQRLVETFDYTNSRLLSEEPIDKLSRQFIYYSFDTPLKDSDRVTKPLRIGGRCYAYIPYLQIFRLTKDYNDVDSRFLNGVLELLVSPGGRLADLKVHIVAADNSEQVTSFSPDIFSEEDKQFIPATVNGQAVVSRIFLRCQVTERGALDID